MRVRKHANIVFRYVLKASQELGFQAVILKRFIAVFRSNFEKRPEPEIKCTFHDV